MDSKTIANGILRSIAILTGVVLLLYFLYLIQTVLIYLLITGVVSLNRRPIVQFKKKRLKFHETQTVI